MPALRRRERIPIDEQYTFLSVQEYLFLPMVTSSIIMLVINSACCS